MSAVKRSEEIVCLEKDIDYLRERLKIVCEDLKGEEIARRKKDEQHGEAISAILQSKEDSETGAGIALKIALAAVGIFVSLGGAFFGYNVIDAQADLRVSIEDEELIFREHETAIEARDTLQCKDIETALRLIKQHHDVVIPDIDCGAGAGH